MNSKTSTVVEFAFSAKLKLLRKLIMQEKNFTIYQTLKDTLQNWAKLTICKNPKLGHCNNDHWA